MFTCKLFLSGPVELVLIVCKTLKVLLFVKMQNTFVITKFSWIFKTVMNY